MSEQTITITVEEYEALLQDSAKLNCLEGAGVDNWDGYDWAMEEFYSNSECLGE